MVLINSPEEEARVVILSLLGCVFFYAVRSNILTQNAVISSFASPPVSDNALPKILSASVFGFNALCEDKKSISSEDDPNASDIPSLTSTTTSPDERFVLQTVG